MIQEQENSDDEHEGEVSLEDLTAAFAEVYAQQHDSELDNTQKVSVTEQSSEALLQEAVDGADEIEDAEDELAISPLAIIEGALFIGSSESRFTSASDLAALMRDVSANEIRGFVDELNESYRDASQALQILHDEGGFRMTVTDKNESVRSAFAGKMREARLPQLAIEVLALVAYQPSISATEIHDQRGRDCSAILNQLVRRRLLFLEREKPKGGGRAIARYRTTDRFLELFGLETLEDLPQVHDDLA